jgi:phosphoribosyl 1,2-cyclic phosphate phosphodiesterase
VRVTFLGTGAAGGVPLYGCDCVACVRARSIAAFRRLPCSALVEDGTTRILLDAGLTDLGERFSPGSLSSILLTHYHPDHVQGLLHLRWGLGESITVHGPPDSEGCADLYKNPGLLNFRTLAKFEPFEIGTLRITPLPLIHSKPTFGYAFESDAGQRFAYLTDTIGLPPRTEEFLRGWEPHGLALDCSHPPQAAPKNHNDWTRALELIEGIRPQQAWLTHVSHLLDAWLCNRHLALSPGIHVARDGLAVPVDAQDADPYMHEHRKLPYAST